MGTRVLDPALRNLLIEAARRSDTSQHRPDDDWDFQPVPSTSRASFQPSSSHEGYYIPHSYARGNGLMTDGGQTFQISSYGETSARGRFYNLPPTRSEQRDAFDRFPYSQAFRNQYTPARTHAIYDRALGPNDADGMQKIQCATTLAKVKKLDLQTDHFVATMDDNTSPVIASASFQDFLSNAHADHSLAAIFFHIFPFSFDARGTDNSSFIDNLTRVYKDVFERVHDSRPFLINFQLLVNEFCTLGEPLEAQINRIIQMLRCDTPST
uniref:Uncharacterized protein n=1 Tax=Panagrolaimus sp. PS1159 TaxID=55785 RepID=A0AC35GHP3_9BILA